MKQSGSVELPEINEQFNQLNKKFHESVEVFAVCTVMFNFFMMIDVIIWINGCNPNVPYGCPTHWHGQGTLVDKEIEGINGVYRIRQVYMDDNHNNYTLNDRRSYPYDQAHNVLNGLMVGQKTDLIFSGFGICSTDFDTYYFIWFVSVIAASIMILITFVNIVRCVMFYMRRRKVCSYVKFTDV